MKQKTNKLARFKQWILSIVSGSRLLPLSHDKVCCNECDYVHYKDERKQIKENGWISHYCPKCGKEAYFYCH